MNEQERSRLELTKALVYKIADDLDELVVALERATEKLERRSSFDDGAGHRDPGDPADEAVYWAEIETLHALFTEIEAVMWRRALDKRRPKEAL